MTALDLTMLAAIDARIKSDQKSTLAIGTVVSLLDNDNALVTFDGSSQAVPVKLAGDAPIYSSDRVLLVQAGRWWIAVCPLTHRWPSFASNSVTQVLGTTSSSTYSDLPVPCSISFTKQWDATRVAVQVNASGYVSIADTQALYGVNFSSPNQSGLANLDVLAIHWNAATTHLNGTDNQLALGLAADTYTVKLQWKRIFGTGTITCDTKDHTTIIITEVSP